MLLRIYSLTHSLTLWF